MACTGLSCGAGFTDLAEAIRNIIVQDEAGCVGVEGDVDINMDCDTLTDLVACGRNVTLKEAFLSALTADGCGRYKLKIFDLTEGRQ